MKITQPCYDVSYNELFFLCNRVWTDLTGKEQLFCKAMLSKKEMTAKDRKRVRRLFLKYEEKVLKWNLEMI